MRAMSHWVKCPECGAKAIKNEHGIHCIKCMKIYEVKE